MSAKMGLGRGFGSLGGKLLGLICVVTAVAACSKPQPPAAVTSASEAVAATHQLALRETQLTPTPETDPRWADTQKGLIAKPEGQIKNAAGEVIWDFEAFNFVKGDAPNTVNPSLWRQAILNNQAGLYKVKDRVYQVRGFDLSNMTLIEGRTGWIVVDTLTAEETARAAMAFVDKHLGKKPVSAIVYTHSHVDHFGGALGILSTDEANKRKVPIIAPVGFMEEATSENVLMGTAMVRRSLFMYGNNLPRNETGLVDNGLGKAVAYGQVGLIPPNRLVSQSREKLNIDGLEFEFFNVPGSEAPSEFVFYIPSLKTFGGAELFSHTLHNIYTLRGAKVRDALKWTQYMEQAQALAKQADALVLQHNWPVWGQENIQHFMGMQLQVYKFMHDQTVRLLNKGYTIHEVSDEVKLPDALTGFLSARGFYGTVSHNVRGIAQFYLGWYDAHPANLNPVPPVEAAKRYVALAGGSDKVLQAAEKALDAGDFRWAAELGKQVVFADPGNQAARLLQAKALEQMGYQAESGPWRNAYLNGALELRQGPPAQGPKREMFLNLLQHTPTERFLEAMAAAVNPERSAGKEFVIELVLSDVNERHTLQLRNSVLTFDSGDSKHKPQATLKVTKSFFLNMMIGQTSPVDLLTSKSVKIEGSAIKLAQFFSVLDKNDGRFDVMTAKTP